MQLNDVMITLWNQLSPKKELLVQIEKPLNSGFKLMVTADGKRMTVPNAFDFVVALKQYQPADGWNRMTITMTSLKSISIETCFDEKLRQDTLQRVQ